MEKRLIIEIDRVKELMGLNLLTESIEYDDISSLSNLKKGPIKNPKYFILHHSAGRGSAESVVHTLNNRTDKETGKRLILGVQWVIDREGKIFRTLPKGAEGRHILNADMSGVPSDINNTTAEGVEIIGNNNSDILEIQCLSALKLVKELGYSYSQIYGHGEVNSHKASNEGQFCKPFLKTYWNDNLEELEKKVLDGQIVIPREKSKEKPKEKPKEKSKEKPKEQNDDEISMEELKNLKDYLLKKGKEVGKEKINQLVDGLKKLQSMKVGDISGKIKDAITTALKSVSEME